MKKLFLLTFGLFILHAAWSQAKIRTQLSGKVTDTQSGLPLAGASIILSDSRIGTTTDSSGNYLLRNLPSGHTIIEVSYTGYKSIVDHIDVIPGNNTKDFSLISSIIENEAVTITAVGSATSIRKAPISIARVTKTELLSMPSTNIIDAI